MVMLAPGKVFRSKEPRIAIDNKLAVGKHRIRLTVLDTSSNESAPADLTIVVREERTAGPVPPVVARPTGPVIRGPVGPVVRNTVVRDIPVPIVTPNRRNTPNG